MARIITKNSTTPSNTPTDIVQGELAINTSDGKLFYGSGSVAKEYTASLALSASYLIGGGSGTPGGSDTEIQFNSGSTFAGDSSFTFNYISQSLQHGGGVTASGAFSHAEGLLAQAIGIFSHAEGVFTTSNDPTSHTEGISNTVLSGSYIGSSISGILFFIDQDLTGVFSTGTSVNVILLDLSTRQSTVDITKIDNINLDGSNTIIELQNPPGVDGLIVISNIGEGGAGSHAEGIGTTVSAPGSHTEGLFTTTFGLGSHAEGLYTVAVGDYQHVQGRYNLSSSAQSAFIIGNGLDDSNRSNLVFASGSQFQITGSLQVTGSAFIKNLSNTAQVNIVTIDTASGQLFVTASSAIGGGGGSSTPGGANTTIQFNDAGAFSGSGNFTFDKSTNEVNLSGSLINNGLTYPPADNGEFSFIQSDGNGNLSLQYVNTIYETIHNSEATTVVKGTPLYVSGSTGANSNVYRADAGNPTKMPVVYIAADNIASGDTGRGIVLGLITGVNTTGYPGGTEIYVAVGGGWTSTRPTGSAIIQVLGIVTKEGMGGQGLILNPGPANLPNLPSGSVWVGNSGSIPTAIPTSSLSVASASFAVTASYVLNGVTILKKENITLASGSWVSASLYEYTYTDTDIAASSSIVDFTPNTASFTTVVNAIIYPTVMVTNSTASFYATNQPANDITGELVITNI
jgi:hypothetical protein